jgi:general nucleoside transport system permease protein
MKYLSSYVTIFAVAVGFAVALLLTGLLGENPLNVAHVLIRGSVGSPTALGYSLFYATPLIFTGLSVAWALKAGLFNIGAEGQMTVGGVAMAIAGITCKDLPTWIAWPLALSAGFAAGAFWAWLVAWLKVNRGVHEVLGSILLNFVSYGVAGLFILNIFRNSESANPETLEMGHGFQLSILDWVGGTSPLNVAFIFALIGAAIIDLLIRRSKLGLDLRWTGGAPEFARRSGLSISGETMRAMIVSGGLAGLAGASVIMGYMHKAREGFAGGAGFVGIAVALLGRANAWGVVAAALLFGCLQKGSLDLDIDTENISRDLAVVIQALIVIAVAARPVIEQPIRDWFAKRMKAV